MRGTARAAKDYSGILFADEVIERLRTFLIGSTEIVIPSLSTGLENQSVTVEPAAVVVPIPGALIFISLKVSSQSHVGELDVAVGPAFDEVKDWFGRWV